MRSQFQNPNCHFDRSNASRCEAEKSVDKTDSSTRPEKSGLARNDDHTLAESGFSLTEVLLAVGTLALGMLFIAGVFPVSIHFTTIAAERTIAATVADEAFAKIKLYGVNFSDPDLVYVSQANFEDVNLLPVSAGEFAYPSIPATNPALKRYWWSAICRRVGPTDVQVTVFVNRKAGIATTYLGPGGPGAIRPYAYRVSVTLIGNDLQINNLADRSRINDGYTIVDDTSGRIYRVLERYKSPNDNIIRLDKSWQGLPSGSVWVIPPPSSVGRGRYPCIAVYQKVMRF